MFKSSGGFSGQKVLVTGASGFLGSHLCERLRQAGAEIYGVSRMERSGGPETIQWRKVDLTEAAQVRRLWSSIKPDIVFHLSALSSAGVELDLVLPTFSSILVSTVNILTIATEAGCRRMVFAASLTEPVRTDNEPVPGSPYAAAKWASSVYANMFVKLYGAPIVTVRPFMTFGPGQDFRKLVPYVTLSLLRGEAPKLSSGKWEADWIYIDDVIEGLATAAQAADVQGCAIDLGSGVLESVRSVVQRLVALTESSVDPLFGALPDRPHEQARAANTGYTFQKLGWRPKTSLSEGLERTVEWYRKQLSQRNSGPQVSPAP